MIQIKTMKQIATSRSIPGVRSLASLGRQNPTHYRLADLGRIQASLGQIQSSDARRVWLNNQWHVNRG